jgi:hypothetical protein
MVIFRQGYSTLFFLEKVVCYPTILAELRVAYLFCRAFWLFPRRVFFDKPQAFRNFASAQLPLSQQQSHMVLSATNHFRCFGDSAVVLVDHGQSAGGFT